MRSLHDLLSRGLARAALLATAAPLAFASAIACNGDAPAPLDQADSGTVADASLPPSRDDAGLPGDWLDLLAAPISTEAPTMPVVDHGLSPNPLWGEHGAPYPTNAWWLNLVLAEGSNVVSTIPYLVRAQPDRLGACIPERVVASTYVLSTYLENLSFGAVEGLDEHSLATYDALSATLQWRGSGGSMTAPLVRGMAYVTARYAGLTPRLRTQHAIVAVNGASASPVTATRFAIELNNGQTWLVYADSSITLTWGEGELTASAPGNVTLRAALRPDAAGEAVLDAHAAAIPLGGTITAHSRDDVGRLRFHWQVDGEGAPLIVAMPHHREVLQSPTTTALEYQTLRGRVVGVADDTWTMLEPLPTIGWGAPRDIDPTRRDAVAAALEADQTMTTVAGDPYFFGKQIAAMGRLAVIADELERGEIATAIRARMAVELAPWLDGSGAKLVYDRTWGGIVATGAQNDPGAAFGQGYYNDHHFHYGYFLYAAAALARGDETWAAANRGAVEALARNIANPHAEDPWFTPFRNKDWYAGHSWAAGLFDFADSRNQESTSEAVNAWYGLAQYGLVVGDDRLRDLGRLQLATELRSTHTYWQIRSGSEIYPAPFADNKVVGVLWATKVDYATFFGGEVELIHGIQMLPFTPITELLLPAEWIAEEYPVLASALDRPAPPLSEGWRGFIVMAHAIVDADAAWNEAQTLTAYDDGNSLTNTLYWIATRP